MEHVKDKWAGKMNFIKKIWEGNVDEAVHEQFVRFSRGKFELRAVINFRISKEIKFTTTFELANDVVLFISGLGVGAVVEGIVLSRKDLSDFLEEWRIKGESKKKKAGLYENKILRQELNSQKLKCLADAAYYSLLDIEAEGINLKTKKKLPRPSKSSKAGKINDKFCSVTLNSRYKEKLCEDFLFGLAVGKKVRVEHTFVVKEIKVPEKFENFEEARRNAKRRVEIIRKAEVDGEQIVSEKEFLI